MAAAERPSFFTGTPAQGRGGYSNEEHQQQLSTPPTAHSKIDFIDNPFQLSPVENIVDNHRFFSAEQPNDRLVPATAAFHSNETTPGGRSLDHEAVNAVVSPLVSCTGTGGGGGGGD